MAIDQKIAIADLVRAASRGKLRRADMICRALIAQYPQNPQYWSLLGDIALALRRPDIAMESYHAVLRLDPKYDGAEEGIESAKQGELWLRQNVAGVGPRYLLIKAWGAGFWSDVRHVISMLFAAELMGRIPVIEWGANSLFGSRAATNAWEAFFEPVSTATIDDLRGPNMTFFPPKWSSANIADNDLQKWSGQYSRFSALYFFNRPESVVVADFFDSVADLVQWVEPGSRFIGKSQEEIYRSTMTKHLRLQTDLAEEIERFWLDRMAGRRWLGVHMRGADKVVELSNLAEINESYFSLIDEKLELEPALDIFLLTDSLPLLARIRDRYGERVLTTDSLRVDGEVGVHFSGHSGPLVGAQVLKDVYLAGRCDYFIGNGTSNVSFAVEHMKVWTEGTYRLLGPDWRRARYALTQPRLK